MPGARAGVGLSPVLGGGGAGSKARGEVVQAAREASGGARSGRRGGWGAGSRGGAAEAGGWDALCPCFRAGDALSVSLGEGPGPGQPSWVERGRRWVRPGRASLFPAEPALFPSGLRLFSRALTRWDCRGDTGVGWEGRAGLLCAPLGGPGWR